jgi:hypothetical protein
MTAFEDGRHCPSLQSFLEVSVEEASLVWGEGAGAYKALFDGAGGSGGSLRVRVRLHGNAMSRPPVELGGLDPLPPRGTPAPSEDGTRGIASVLGKGQDGSEGWTFYPVHHDLEATLLVIEVSGSPITHHTSR